jgi:hypothetical protein
MKTRDMVTAEYEAGRTYPIALRVVNGRLKVAKPELRVVGYPGYETWYYKDDVVMLLYLDKSSIGRDVIRLPWCGLPGWLCDRIKEFAKKLWVEEGKSEREVEAALESLNI